MSCVLHGFDEFVFSLGFVLVVLELGLWLSRFCASRGWEGKLAT